MSVDRPIYACPHAREWLCIARAHSIPALVLLLLLVLADAPAFAQASSSTLTGRVLDQSGAVVPGAEITVVNADSAFERKVDTDRSGAFAMPFIPPGRYVVLAQRDGFATSEIRDLVLNINDQIAVSITLAVRKAEETTSVVAQAARASVAAGTGTVVDRKFLENIPLNGSSLHGLMQLVPGVVLTQNDGSAANGAQFSVSGQRTTANVFQVDGVSANTGLGVNLGGLSSVSTASGQSAGTNALGGTSSLASIDAIQEFRIETSNFAPEYGRAPGGHIALVTRGGTNALHGSATEYFRHEALNANDWFVNYLGVGEPQMRQHLFSGVLGGPLRKDQLFFFGSYEALRLQQPKTRSITVANRALRERAPAAIKPYLDALPLPNGRALSADTAQLNASFSEPSSAHSAALRVDAALLKSLTGFVRVSHAPSRIETRVASLSTISSSEMVNDYVTAGATWLVKSRLSLDTRVNWTRNRSTVGTDFDAFGGAVQPGIASAFPSGRDPSRGNSTFDLGGAGSLGLGVFGLDTQRQLNFTGTMAWVASGHQLKVGVDYLRLAPSLTSMPSEALYFDSINDLSTSRASYYQTNSAPAPRKPVFSSLSLYAQDVWQLARRLTVTYGARFERVPSPTETNGQQPPVVAGLDKEPLIDPHLAPAGTPMWRPRAGEVALRVGVAYQLLSRAGWEATVRGGGGTFYDLGLGQAAYAFRDVFPFYATRYTPDLRVPLPDSVLTPPVLGQDPPLQLRQFDPNIRLPYTRQWHVTWEQGIGASQTVTASYVAARGHRLLAQQWYNQPLAEWPTSNTMISVQRNFGRSTYDSLQVQYQRRLHRGLQVLGSYTVSRSRDNGSADQSVLPAENSSTLFTGQWAASDFDVRHLMSVGVTFEPPSSGMKGVVGAMLSDWGVDLMVRKQSGLPGTPMTRRAVGTLFGFTQRADVVSDVPVYLEDQSVPGGRRVNPAAFVVPTDRTRQGTAPRNSLRMFGAMQTDLALRREIWQGRGLRCQFKFEVFNVLNQPNFGPYFLIVGLPQFGVVRDSLNTSLGGLNPLYQMGGARSAQVSLRVSF